MHDLLKAELERLRVTEDELFEYVHTVTRQGAYDPTNDVAQYRLHGVIPAFVRMYLLK